MLGIFNSGTIERSEIVPHAEGTNELLRELLAQNRKILETNCQLIQSLGTPMVRIGADPAEETAP